MTERIFLASLIGLVAAIAVYLMGCFVTWQWIDIGAPGYKMETLRMLMSLVGTIVAILSALAMRD